MELSKKDRVVLVNQFQILKRLDPENRVRYEELIDILTFGYEIFYPKVSEYVSDGMNRKECTLVLEILDIYSMIEFYKRDNPTDQQVAEHEWGRFRGFDGLSEPEYVAFARFLIETQGNFAEQLRYAASTNRFEWRTPTVPKYRRMIAAWDGLHRRALQWPADILMVLNA